MRQILAIVVIYALHSQPALISTESLEAHLQIFDSDRFWLCVCMKKAETLSELEAIALFCPITATKFPPRFQVQSHRRFPQRECQRHSAQSVFP